MISDWVRAVGFIAPALLYAVGWLQVWHLFAFAVLTGLAEAVFQPAIMAFLPSLVADKQLVRANALMDGTGSVLALLGPALGAALVKSFGAGPALLADGISFAISAMMFGLMSLPRLPAIPPEARQPFMKELGAGYGFFRRHKELIWLALLVHLPASGARPSERKGHVPASGLGAR